MTAKEVTQSHYFKIAAVVVGLLLLVLISFSIGVAVGFHKARFSFAFGENYERNFVGPHGGPEKFLFKVGGPAGPGGPDFRNGHGVAGKVISVTDNSIVIKDRDDKENTIAVTEKTLIKRFKDDVKVSDLKADDKIVVIGKPGEDGAIEAEFIRVFDANLESD